MWPLCRGGHCVEVLRTRGEERRGVFCNVSFFVSLTGQEINVRNVEEDSCIDKHWSCFYNSFYESVCDMEREAANCKKSCGLCKFSLVFIIYIIIIITTTTVIIIVIINQQPLTTTLPLFSILALLLPPQPSSFSSSSINNH